MDIWVIIFGICLPLAIIIILLIFDGIKECKNNNLFGVLILTIGLNMIGTVIGCVLLYKNQNPEFKFWKCFWNKIKKMFKFKVKFKRKPKRNNIIPQS